MPPFILTDKTITVVKDGVPYSIPSDNPMYDSMLNAIKANDDLMMDASLSLALKIQETAGKQCTVKDGEVYYGETRLSGAIVDRILSFIEKGIDPAPLQLFIEKLMKNPNLESIKDLYRFLEYNKMPITKDGNFLAYKKVRHDYYDVYSRTFDNSVGKVVSMPRDKVTLDRTVTCSTGLHFASFSYMAHYSGDKIVILEIDPVDVVSIPIDYNNAKGRCSKYKVVGELVDTTNDALGGKDYIDELRNEPSVSFSFDFEEENMSDQKINNSERDSRVIDAMSKDPSKMSIQYDDKLDMLVPNFKYCHIDKGKYRVIKSWRGKKYNFGYFDNIKDAEDMVYRLVEAMLDDNIQEFILANATNA